MKRLWGMLLLVVVLARCGPFGAAQPVASPMAQSSPTTVALAPTRSPAPSPTAQPSATPAPTATTTPTAEPTATVEPTMVEPTATPRPELTSEEREKLFNDVWQTVNEHYLYPDFNGVDWQQVRRDFAPQVAAAVSSADLYTVLAAMIEKLNDNHSRFTPPEEAQYEDAVASGNDTYVGIGVMTNYEPGAAFVTLVFPDSPAAEGGLQRGDRIIAVNSEPFTDTGQIRGPENTQVTLTIRSPQAEPRDVTLTRRAVVGKIRPLSQRLPNAPEIGYLLIPSLWADDMHTQVITQLKSLRQADAPLRGVVMDLRSNGGGWRTVLEGILAQFTSGKVGDFFSSGEAYALEITPGAEYEAYARLPLVVLVDNGSASYAEVLAGSLQFMGATVIGVPTAGNTETIFQYNFDDGSRLWVAQEGYKLPDGTNFEGSGVQPDVVVTEDWTQYALPNDPAILQAIDVINRKAGN